MIMLYLLVPACGKNIPQNNAQELDRVDFNWSILEVIMSQKIKNSKKTVLKKVSAGNQEKGSSLFAHSYGSMMCAYCIKEWQEDKNWHNFVKNSS